MTQLVNSFWGASLNPLTIFGADLEVWFRPESRSLNSGDPCATWLDDSGNGRNATQATGAKQPTHVTNVLNGFPSLAFDGANDEMEFDGTWAAGSNYTWYVVTVNTTAGAASYPIAGDDFGTDKEFFLGWSGSTDARTGQFGNDLPGVTSYPEIVVAPTPRVLSVLRRAGGREMYGGGVSLATDADTTTLVSYNSARLGKFNFSTGQIWFAQQLIEVIGVSRDATDPERLACDAYISAKYAF